jgi:hypothetical protein
MGFLLEGAYGIAVLTVLARSAMKFRQGYGFGTPVVSLDRTPMIGQEVQLTVSVPTRFNGTADLKGCLKSEAKDTRLFSLSDEKPNSVLMEQHFLLAKSQRVSKDGKIEGTAALIIPNHMLPSTPGDARVRIHLVWSLVLTADGDGGRRAETVYILQVVNAPLDHKDDTRNGAGSGRPVPPGFSG